MESQSLMFYACLTGVIAFIVAFIGYMIFKKD
jgi:hypothetical protein